MTNVLIILNDAPYGSERAYNAIRLAVSLGKREGVQLRIFLIGDAVACVKKGQRVPSGYYNVETMLGLVVHGGGTIGVCGTCLDARGIGESELLEGSRRSSMNELSAWVLESERILTF